MRTKALRDLMKQKQRILAELDNQAKCPSRGFSEDDAFERLDDVNHAIADELNDIDEQYAKLLRMLEPSR